MKAICFSHHGGPEVLRSTLLSKPIPEPSELLVRVYATTVNRKDVVQRRSPQNSAKEINVLGDEIAGEVIAKGKNTSRYKKGQRVFGMVDGGGYAEYCTISESLALPIPDHWSYEYAAAIPKSFITANEALFEQGHLQKGESILIHAGGGGVGTASIQFANYIGAKIFVTAGSDEKIKRALEIGAHSGINYQTQDFAYHIQNITNHTGVDVVQDFIGAKYLARNINCLKPGGRLILVSLLDGTKGDINLIPIISKRLQIRGSIVDEATLEEKQDMVNRFEERWLPILKEGHIKPVIDYVFPWEMIQEAHKHMEHNRNFGKIVLKVR